MRIFLIIFSLAIALIAFIASIMIEHDNTSTSMHNNKSLSDNDNNNTSIDNTSQQQHHQQHQNESSGSKKQFLIDVITGRYIYQLYTGQRSFQM